MTNNSIHQSVTGNENIVAGRDIHFKNNTPDINNPNMMYCHCDSVISRGADECPDCGHNHLRDREIEFVRQQQKTENIKSFLIMLLIIIGSAALHISSKYQLQLLDTFIVTLVGAGFLWYGYEYAKAAIQIKYYQWKNERI